jgi:hypothetical protein
VLKSEKTWLMERLAHELTLLCEAPTQKASVNAGNTGDYRGQCNRECQKQLFFLRNNEPILTPLVRHEGLSPRLSGHQGSPTLILKLLDLTSRLAAAIAAAFFICARIA